MICKKCGKEFERTELQSKIGSFCSNHCHNYWYKFNNKPNCECAVCHRPIYIRESKLRMNIHGVCCCRECENINRSRYFKGKNNHQYNKIGDKNASFKPSAILTNYGYLLEYGPEHPFPHDKSQKCIRVLQHRLVIESNHELFDDEYFIIINGKYYLKPEYVVHHKNGNKADNRIENLAIMDKGSHSLMHCKENLIIRDTKGRIIGVVKSGKNGEPCDGNTVLTSEIAQGSEAV